MQGAEKTLKIITNLLKDKGIFWNFVSLIVLGIGGILINSLLLFFRGEEAVGIFNQAYAIYIVLSQIGVAGLHFSVLNRLSLTNQDLEGSSRITGSALLLVFVFSTLISSVGWLIAPSLGDFLQSQEVAASIRLIMPGLVFFCLNKVLINVLNAFDEMIAYALFRTMRFVLIPLFVVVVIIFGWENPYFALSLTVTEVVLFLSLAIFILKKLLRIRLSLDEIRNYQDHLKFSAKGFFSGVLVELNTRMDVLILGYFVGDYSVGLYSFVATLAEGFSQFGNALRWNIDPELGRLINSEDRIGIEDLASSIRRDYYKFFLVGCIGIVAIYPFAFRILNGSYNWLSFLMFSLMMVGVAFGVHRDSRFPFRPMVPR